MSLTYEVPDPGQAPNRLAGMIASYLTNGQPSIAEAVDVVGPHIPGAAAMDIDDLALAIAELWVGGLRGWQGLWAQDSRTVIDFGGNHQRTLWEFLGYGDLPFDVAVTNQLVASAELYGFSLGAAIQGGLSPGSTAFSRAGQFGAFAMVSTFSLVNDYRVSGELVAGRKAPDATAIRIAALMIAHEIGHILLRIGHPRTRPGCIMSSGWFEEPPTPGPQCPVGSEPAMTPGAAMIFYDRVLLDTVQQ